METTRTVNFRGRFEFLEASEKYWREPLDVLLSLRPAMPKFVPPPPARLSDLNLVAGAGELRDAIWSWAERFQICDTWIRDAALQTVIANANGKQDGWKYAPPELEPGIVEFRIGSWIPPVSQPLGQPWEAFKKAAMKVFLAKLERYRKDTLRVWGANQPALSVHAEWAVLWQKGKSPEYIRNWNARTHMRKVSLANIQTRVAQFAQAVGLTLRHSRRMQKTI